MIFPANNVSVIMEVCYFHDRIFTVTVHLEKLGCAELSLVLHLPRLGCPASHLSSTLREG